MVNLALLQASHTTRDARRPEGHVPRHLEQLPIAPPMPPLDALGARLGYGLSPQVPTSPSRYVVVRSSGQLGNGRVCGGGGGGGGGGGAAAVSVRAKVACCVRYLVDVRRVRIAPW